jgi:hypothetical protein
MVFFAVITLAIFIPRLYWIAFEKPVKKPIVHYSCVNNGFMIKRGEKEWMDANGNQYTRKEYEQKLPFMFFKQLLASGTMPDSINGIPVDTRSVSRSDNFFRLKANEIDAPKPDLFPLFESQSGRAQIELPDDFFRITWRIDFIDAATNKILEEKSQLFSAALYHFGFVFPAKQISGLSTPRKSCDEGYLIVDSKDQLFHLKMIKGKPFVKKIELPDGLIFKQISCVDFKNKAFYAYLFSESNEVYILTQKEYKLIRWPIDGADLANCDLKIYGDLFNYTVIAEGKDRLKAIALDPEYRFVNSYTESWKTKEMLREGKVFASVFPARLSLESDNSKFIRLYFWLSPGINWLFVNALLFAAQLIWLRFRKCSLKSHWPDLGIVLVCGVYGLAAIHLFPNKFFE